MAAPNPNDFLLQQYGIDARFIDYDVPVLLNFLRAFGNGLSFKEGALPSEDTYRALAELIRTLMSDKLLVIIDSPVRMSDALQLISQVKNSIEGEWLSSLENTLLQNKDNTRLELDTTMLFLKKIDFKYIKMAMQPGASQDKMALLQNGMQDLQAKIIEITAARDYLGGLNVLEGMDTNIEVAVKIPTQEKVV